MLSCYTGIDRVNPQPPPLSSCCSLTIPRNPTRSGVKTMTKMSIKTKTPKHIQTTSHQQEEQGRGDTSIALFTAIYGWHTLSHILSALLWLVQCFTFSQRPQDWYDGSHSLSALMTGAYNVSHSLGTPKVSRFETRLEHDGVIFWACRRIPPRHAFVRCCPSSLLNGCGDVVMCCTDIGFGCVVAYA